MKCCQHKEFEDLFAKIVPVLFDNSLKTKGVSAAYGIPGQ